MPQSPRLPGAGWSRLGAKFGDSHGGSHALEHSWCANFCAIIMHIALADAQDARHHQVRVPDYYFFFFLKSIYKGESVNI